MILIVARNTLDTNDVLLGAMSVGILSKNILVWDVIYISIGNFRCSIMKVCGNFCMSMASADKCTLICF